MRLGSVTAPRLAYYDRNAGFKEVRAGPLSQAPTPGVVLVSQAVPANRNAVITSLFYRLYRDTAAVSANICGLGFQYVPGGGGSVNIGFTIHVFGAVNDRDYAIIPSQIFLRGPGDLQITWFDYSSGGSVSILTGMSYIEYDP